MQEKSWFGEKYTALSCPLSNEKYSLFQSMQNDKILFVIID